MRLNGAVRKSARAVVTAIAATGIFFACVDRASAAGAAGSRAAAKPVSAAEEARFNECKRKLIAAQKLDVLYDLDWKPPREPKVVVGPTFLSIDFESKKGFAETVNCFLMAGRRQYVNFDVLHWQTGKAIGRYSYGRFEMK